MKGQQREGGGGGGDRRVRPEKREEMKESDEHSEAHRWRVE